MRSSCRVAGGAGGGGDEISGRSAPRPVQVWSGQSLATTQRDGMGWGVVLVFVFVGGGEYDTYISRCNSGGRMLLRSMALRGGRLEKAAVNPGFGFGARVVGKNK